MDESTLKFLIDYLPVFGGVVLLLLIALLLLPSLSAPKPFLNPTEFKPLVLSEKKQITHNTVWLRFKLPSPSQKIGLPIGQHITFLGKVSSP